MSPDILSEISDLKGRRQGEVCCSWLTYVSNLDRSISEKIAKNDNTWLEVLLFCIPAHMFNRMIILVPMSFCVLLGARYYDNMLEYNNFRALGDEIEDSTKLALGICFFV